LLSIIVETFDKEIIMNATTEFTSPVIITSEEQRNVVSLMTPPLQTRIAKDITESASLQKASEYDNCRLTLGVAELMKIFDVSRPSIYRWASEARRGVGTFPKPLDVCGWRRQQLRWNRDEIMAIVNSDCEQ
jgi:predicted DNA-binding transcriptional regulator AlpA